MDSADFTELNQKILLAAKESEDETSLLTKLNVVVQDFSTRFPKVGGPMSLYSACMFLFDHNREHLSFFQAFCQETYRELTSIDYWDRSSLVAERMTMYQIDLYGSEKSNIAPQVQWFNHWKVSVENWFKRSVNERSWAQLGSGLFSRCEAFASSPILSEEVQSFWDLMIDEYGSFTPIESTLENLKKQVSEFAQIAMRNFDSTKAVSSILADKVRMLEKINAGEVVDMMNKLIAMAPKDLSSEEIEMAMNFIQSCESLVEACDASNELATTLRLSGEIEDAIEVLKQMTERPGFDVSYDKMALSSFKLGIYLDETGRKEEAGEIFFRLAEQEPQMESGRISIRTVMDASHRYSTLLHEAGNYELSKHYSLREHHLSEQVGDPFVFVRSCFNITNDCRLLNEDKEAIYWFELGMMNLKDACMNPNYVGTNPMGNQLIEQSRNLATLIGVGDEKWKELLRRIFIPEN